MPVKKKFAIVAIVAFFDVKGRDAMKKFTLGVFITAVLTLTAFMFTVPASAAAKESGIEGLWVTVPTWPEKYDDEELKIEKSGEVSYWRNMNSLLFLTVNRWKSSSAGDADAVKEAVAKKLKVKASSIKIEQTGELSEKYSYPTYYLAFSSGANEDSSERYGLFIAANEWDFYLDVAADADYVGGYRDEEFDMNILDNWFSNLKIVEN
jgi:hypothetical protein